MPDGSNFGGNFGGIAPAPENRDIEIATFCTAILRLRKIVSEDLTHDTPCGSPSEVALNKTFHQLEKQQRRMVNHMCRIRAKSMMAHKMRAVTVRAWFDGGPKMLLEEQPDAMRILEALVRDLLDSDD